MVTFMLETVGVGDKFQDVGDIVGDSDVDEIVVLVTS